MASFLYRPHIHLQHKVLTIDFLVLSACDVVLGRSVIYPALGWIAGDTVDYAAPALCLVDSRFLLVDQAAAWGNARVLLSRFAHAPSRDEKTSWFLHAAGTSACVRSKVPDACKLPKGCLVIEACPCALPSITDETTVELRLAADTEIKQKIRMRLLDSRAQP
jgi:hypothetical protein